MGIEPSSSTEQKPILHTERKQTMKMKMQTNRIKRILSTILLLLLAVGMVTSCTKKPPKIEQPDEALLEQIAEDYYNYMCTYYDYGKDHPIDDRHTPQSYIRVNKCYGIYNGCVAVIFSPIGQLSIGSYEETVAGFTFYFSGGPSIKFWSSGGIYSMQEAYDQGLITQEDLKTIFELYNA